MGSWDVEAMDFVEMPLVSSGFMQLNTTLDNPPLDFGLIGANDLHTGDFSWRMDLL